MPGLERPDTMVHFAGEAASQTGDAKRGLRNTFYRNKMLWL